MLEYIEAAKHLLDIWRHLTGSGKSESRRDVVLTNAGVKGLAHGQLTLTDQHLEAFPHDRESQLFKRLDKDLRTVFFYDNVRLQSEALVFYLHGLGLDRDDFHQVLLETKYRSIAPTLYGFHPEDKNPIALPLEAHRHIVARFIEEKIGEIKPRKVVLVGFSTGADILRSLGQVISIDAGVVCGVLLLDTNINRETCFISRELRKPLDEDLSALELAHRIGSSATDINDWLDLHQYLVKVLGKFKINLRHLARFADNIYAEHVGAGTEQFVERYQACLSWAENSLFLFSKGDVHEALISDINSHLLGGGDGRRGISWERETSHFGLIEASFLERNLDGFLSQRQSRHVTPASTGRPATPSAR